jgi:hypothetical protein
MEKCLLSPAKKAKVTKSLGKNAVKVFDVKRRQRLKPI